MASCPARQLEADKSGCDNENYAEDNNDTWLAGCPILPLNKLLRNFANLDSCHFNRLLQSKESAKDSCQSFESSKYDPNIEKLSSVSSGSTNAIPMLKFRFDAFVIVAV